MTTLDVSQPPIMVICRGFAADQPSFMIPQHRVDLISEPFEILARSTHSVF